MPSERSQSWFENWFDTPFYHALYKSRDENEAARFLELLLQKLNLPEGARVLDLACGKGRHSQFLNQKGYQVLGVDLSENSISKAKELEGEHLHFRVGDMRLPQGNQEFDAVFNLFTSFGYFESSAENLKTLHSVWQSLKPGGLLVIDFMNSEKAIRTLQPEYRLARSGIEFFITKSIENEIISKKIRFSESGKDYEFEERVQLLTLKDFEAYFSETGFQILQIFGDYSLNPFDSQESDRLILIGQKPSI